MPEALKGDRKIWGVSTQLYALKSKRNWGIGDFTDLREFIEIWAGQGAAMVGVNPLHAMYPHKPERASPYGPSSRLFLNVMYIDVEAVQEFNESIDARELFSSPDFQAKLRMLRESDMLDNAGVYHAKLSMLELLYRQFRQGHINAGTERAEAFREFQRARGEKLFRHCLFDALSEKFIFENPETDGWKDWPLEYRDPFSDAVKQFAEENLGRVEYFEYMQWQAHVQLEMAGMRSMEMGLGVGLYQDLAVGCYHNGSDTWVNQHVHAHGCYIGSPPDDFNFKGQVWYLTPFNPGALREEGYAPFIEVLREAMRNTGALRIDHVMAFTRLFWVPADKSALEGTYVDYPVDDLIGILALESQRNRCLIIGEDLGTVPAYLPPLLKEYGIFSYRVFYLEQDEKAHRPPSAYPEQAMVVVNTHDLPTLIGYWQGRDLLLRKEHNAFPSDDLREKQVLARARDRTSVLVALENQGLLPEEISTEDPKTVPEMSEDLILAIHTYLARTPSKIFNVAIDDVTKEADQVNLPGTGGVHNWLRKLSMDLDDLKDSAFMARLSSMLRKERGTLPAQAKADRLKSLAAEISPARHTGSS